jgi:hypothetical protein
MAPKSLALLGAASKSCCDNTPAVAGEQIESRTINLLATHAAECWRYPHPERLAGWPVSLQKNVGEQLDLIWRESLKSNKIWGIVLSIIGVKFRFPTMRPK